MIAVCWKRNQLPSARFDIRSVFRKEWPPELEADLVQGPTASERREFFFAWGVLLRVIRFASQMGTTLGVLRMPDGRLI